MRNDARLLNQSIRRRAQQEVFAIARQTLADLAEASLEERLTVTFVRRLTEMDEATKKQLLESLGPLPSPARVRSAFALTKEQQKSMEKVVHDAFRPDLPILFETEPDLVAGIEFATQSHKIAWTIDHYLSGLEKAINDVLDKQTLHEPHEIKNALQGPPAP